MKKLLSISILLITSLSLNAQISFKTGDAELDADLTSINTSAKADLTTFKTDLISTYGVSQKNLDYMFSINMEPGEIYFALEISKSTNQPIEKVIDTYEANRDKGWGYVAQEMGIKPGSPEFHALKGKAKEKKEKNAKGISGGNGNSNTGNGNKGNGSSTSKNTTTKKTTSGK